MHTRSIRTDRVNIKKLEKDDNQWSAATLNMLGIQQKR